MSETELQTISIHVKVSAEERDRFIAAAKEMGKKLNLSNLGVSTWMRMLANEATKREPVERQAGH